MLQIRHSLMKPSLLVFLALVFLSQSLSAQVPPAPPPPPAPAVPPAPPAPLTLPQRPARRPLPPPVRPDSLLAPGTEAHFLSNVRQLTFEGKRSGEGYFSPDGKALIFQSEREPDNPFYQIYLLDLESGDSHRVSPGTGKTTCAFFRPWTDEVLFASTHLDPGAKAKQKAELDFRASVHESWE